MSTAPTHHYSYRSQSDEALPLLRGSARASSRPLTRVASTRSAVQALSGVMISAPADGCPELLATDMEIGLRVAARRRRRAPRRGRAAGAAAARRRPLAARRGAHDGAARRRAGRRADLRRHHVPPAHAARRGLPVAARARAGRPRVTLPADAFVETITRVARSASRDETRPVLTGILMSASGQELRMVATDSYRLSVKETALEHAARGLARGERTRAGAAGARARSQQQTGADDGRRQRRSEPGRSSSSATSCSPRG